MKNIVKIFLLMLAFSTTAHASQNAALVGLFPGLSELPGGKDHWVMSILPEEQTNGCSVYSATYAYFTKQSVPLFDIPRKNIYSVNIRFHACENVTAAGALYDKFSSVGDKDKKKLMSVGDKGIIYVVPAKGNPLMGDYYLTSLFKYIVLQVHADDGFVLIDISELMAGRLGKYLRRGSKDIANGLTLFISGKGFDNSTQMVNFFTSDVKQIDFSGVIYDQYNNKISGARVTALETGDTTVTNDKGEFSLKLSSGKGKTLNLYRALTVNKNDEPDTATLKSGYYKVDIHYKNNGKTGQDVWKLWVDGAGKVNGISLNMADEKRLAISGSLSDDNLTINRPCGESFMGTCRQDFTAVLREGMFEGEWAGSGGGGKWRLYKDSFADKSIHVTPQDVDLVLSGRSIGDNLWEIASGSAPEFLAIKPQIMKHEEFYLKSVKFLTELSSKESMQKQVHLYGIAGNQKKLFSNTPIIPISEVSAGAGFDITSIYTNSKYTLYFLGFPEKDNVTFKAVIKPTVEMNFAGGQPKANVKGAFTAEVTTFEGDDIAGNTKIIRQDGRPDTVIKLSVNIFGSTLQGVQVKSTGSSGTRTWNTVVGNFYPGVGVVSNGTVKNDPDGSVHYPLEKFQEDIFLHMDRGSLDKDSIKSLELTLYVDDAEITVPVTIK